MLSSLKEKFLNVKKNVNIFSTPPEEPKSVKVKKEVNLLAGAKLLSKYQEDWVQIHDLNEENAKEAEKCAKLISNISEKITNDKENIGLISHILTHSNLTSNISNCLSQVNNLYETCERVEQGLVNLECLIEDIEFENMKKKHLYHLNQYEIRKKEGLEIFKAKLEEEHQKKVADFEAQKSSILEERQKVFQEAFKSDLEIYTNSGSIPRLEIPKKQSSALLEEIQLDFDPNELDQFFADNPT